MDFSQVIDYIKKMYKVNNSDFWLSIIRIIFGFVWIFSGLEKILSPEYFSGFAKTIEFFISKNPYPFYTSFMQNFVLPNSYWISYLVSYGELIIGLALVAGILSDFFLAFGIFMNINFYFAASWLNISTAMLNLVMIALQIVLIFSPGSKTLSLDYFLKLMKMKESYVKGKLTVGK